MSKAIKCDRCGFCFNPEKMYRVKEGLGIHEFPQRLNFSDMVISTPETTKENKFASRMADVDLCPICTEEFLIWFTKGQNITRYLSLDVEEKQDEQSGDMGD